MVYDFRTGELHDDTICRFCGGVVNAPTTTPIGQHATEYHGHARCVEGDEPSYKMGGPA